MSGKGVKPFRLSRGFKVRVALFSILTLLVSLAVVSSSLYFMASQEATKGFFSAHRDLYRVWEGLLPAAAIVSAVVWLLASLVLLLGLIRFKRSIERSGRGLLESLRQYSEGNFKVNPGDVPERNLKMVVEVGDEAARVLREHVQEVKSISAELHKAMLRLNYMAFEEEEITLSDLKHLSANLNTLSRELNNSLKWFEV
jgi:hypothetical protein